MKLGVFSDSHGNLEYLGNAAAFAAGRGKADVLIHLGDNYKDAKVLNQFGKRVLRVPGVFANEYLDPSVSNRIVETFGPWNVLITHTSEPHPNDLPADIDPVETVRNKVVQIVLHGHTHIPRIALHEGVWFVNPGHLKRQDKKGYHASFAMLDLRRNDATAKIYQLVGLKELLSKDFPLSAT